MKSSELQIFFDEDDYLNKAIYVAFSNRIAEAVQVALGYVRLTQVQESAEGLQNLYIAKKTCHIFPEQALESLLDLHSSADPKVRRNVIYVIGQMAGGSSIRAVLIDALDDDAYCEDILSESVGEPLRICDVAYNQLVIRYNIKGVVRTIGTIHKIDARDYNIQKIKDLL